MLRRVTGIMVAIAMTVTTMSTTMVRATVKENEEANNYVQNQDEYEIYPLPQEEFYLGESLNITKNINVVFEEGIDESTRNFLSEIASIKELNISVSEEVTQDKTNILIGVRGSNGYVDNYFNSNIEYNESIFNEEDPYVLRIDNNLEESGTIAILGESTDSAYYGLATLKMIFKQEEGTEVETVQFEDFADAKWRGFIEGFYGFPWSHEDRMSLMEFGGEFKMNSYIFAPKDDPYHNSKWRDPYPEEELAKIKELVDVGHESKTQFVWAIHPGFNMINWNKYDEELDTLLNKLQQLYDAGVRQFGLFMDDISTSQSLADVDKHVKLITDVANWVDSKGDTYPLVYCPPFYNQAWTGSTGTPYLQALANVPENVELMWTGSGVCGTANEKDMQWVKDRTGRDPYMWLNWPVNDYKDSRLMLGKGEVLKPGTHNLSGIVSNPMGHAELSKIALFAVADFTWNTDEFNDQESWENSFKYIVPEVAEEFRTISYHMSDPSPSGHGLVLGESENIKTELELFLSNFNNEVALGEVGTELIAEFDNILNAINVFREENTNENMVEEITPWLNCLNYVALSCKASVESAMALENGDMKGAWENLAKASNYMEESKKFTIKKLNYPDVTVEAGTKRLVPFANELITKLDGKIYMELNPEASISSPISSYGSLSNLGLMMDGDESTYTYIQTVQKNGDWYGVDLGKVIKVNDISILQGRNDSDHDIFHRGVLEYSVDGENWIAIGEERSGIKIEEDSLDIEARYIRYRLTHAGIPGGKPDLWTSVREFTVNKNTGKVIAYTNVDELKNTPITVDGVKASISSINDVTLETNEYIGIKLLAIDRIKDIKLEASKEGLTLESSANGVEWNEVISGEAYENARYIRIINKSDSSLNFDLTNLSVELNKFEEPKVTHNYSSVYSGSVENINDGRLDSKVWFGQTQDEGKYVQLDLGGIVDIENIALVIGDGEGDYFREGNLQVSIDGENWENVFSFENGSREQNFPTHEVPYRYRRVNDINKQGRYVRLISTRSRNAWLALNEIIVNEGIESEATKNPAFDATPQGDIGQEVYRIADNKLASFYTPDGEAVEGELLYRLSDYTNVGELVILQNPDAISNAKVEIRDLDGWHEVGNLLDSYNSINTSKFNNVLDIKISWSGDVKPIINEIITVKKIKQEIDKADLETLINQGKSLVEEAVEGFEVGEYHKGAKDALKNEINKAEEVFNKEDAAQEEINSAKEALNSSIERFNSLIIEESTGDFNGNGKIDIGDLAMVSRNYGSTTNTSLDLNKDGAVDQYEINFINHRILN